MKRLRFNLRRQAIFACAFGLWLGFLDSAVGGDINPVLVGSWLWSQPGAATAVTVSGNHAYVAATDYSNGGGVLIVLDISNPGNPQRIGGLTNIGYVLHVAVSDNYALLANGSLGLEVIDISNPADPRRVGTFDNTGDDYGVVALSGSLAYVGGGWSEGTNWIRGLQVIDFSSSTNPQRVGGLTNIGDAYAVAVSDNYVYVAGGWWRGTNYSFGLQVIDVSNPVDPRPLGRVGTSGGGASEVKVSGGYAFVAQGESWDGTNRFPAGMEVLDISNPMDPLRVGRFDTRESPMGQVPCDAVAMSDNYAYLASGDHGIAPRIFPGEGLIVLDISDPTNPQRVGRYDTDGWCLDIAMSGNYLYVADGPNGLKIFEIPPVIASQSIVNGRLYLKWNDAARGMKLQRTTGISNPKWQDLIGSELTNSVVLPLWSGSEFFRLAKP